MFNHGEEMEAKLKLKLLMTLVISVVFLSLPLSAGSSKETERWTYGPWQTQNMVSLGNKILIVDFGPNGLWSYDGTWMRLSHLDPLRMVTWGEANLVVDFGSHGLWTYDQSEWVKIAL